MSELSGDQEITLVNQSQAPVADAFEIGQVVGGKYKIVSLLGRGGIGSVYKVEQILLQQNFALKTLNSQKASDQLTRRFQNEARAASLLSHPNLVKVIDFGLLEGQQPYLVMDLVEGQSLSEYLKKNGALSLEEAVSCFAQICLGLSYAHDQGIVHRDIKPGNVMISSNVPFGSEGFVRVVDFGIAKLAYSEGGEVQALTTTGEIFGSPLYMSPEQCSGAAVDHRSDIYSLGCVLFEALTGTTPFVGQNALSTMMLHQSEKAPSLKEASMGKEFPPELEQIVAKLLAKSPGDRYQNLGIVANDLAQLVKGAPVLGIVEARKKDKTKEDQPLKMSRRELQMWFVVTVLAAGCLGGGVGYYAAGTKLNKDNDKTNEMKTAPFEATSKSVPPGASKSDPIADLDPPGLDQYAPIFTGADSDKNVSKLNQKRLAIELDKVTKILDKNSGLDAPKYRECLEQLKELKERAAKDKNSMQRFAAILEWRIAMCNMRLGELTEAVKHLKLATVADTSPLERLMIACVYQEMGEHLLQAKRLSDSYACRRTAATMLERLYVEKKCQNKDVVKRAMEGAGSCYRGCCELAIEHLKDYKAAVQMGYGAIHAYERLKNEECVGYAKLFTGVAYARDKQLEKAQPLLMSSAKLLTAASLPNDGLLLLFHARNELAANESRLGDNKTAAQDEAKALNALARYKPPKALKKGVEEMRKVAVKQMKYYESLLAPK